MRQAAWNASWDDRPAEYAATRDCWLTRRRVLYVEEFLRAAKPGEHVLDLGSGVGDLAIALAERRPDLSFSGVEPQQSYVDYAVETAVRSGIGNVSFHAGTAEELERALPQGARFDWILSNDMLHHVADVERVLQATAAVAKGRTRWLAIEPNARNPYSFLSAVVRRGERNFWPAAFLAAARIQGWIVQERDYLFLIPPFVRRAPRVLVDLERKLERVPLLAGGVALTLIRAPR